MLFPILAVVYIIPMPAPPGSTLNYWERSSVSAKHASQRITANITKSHFCWNSSGGQNIYFIYRACGEYRKRWGSGSVVMGIWIIHRCSRIDQQVWTKTDVSWAVKVEKKQEHVCGFASDGASSVHVPTAETGLVDLLQSSNGLFSTHINSSCWIRQFLC